MAADYWCSTQRRHWLLTRDKLADIRETQSEQHRSVIQQYPLPDSRLLNMYFRDMLLRVAKRMNARQQTVATAMVYIHRYLLYNPIHTVNAYLLLSTAFYLATKTEESPQHIRLVIAEARSNWPEFIPVDVSRIGEMEFSIISELQSQLIIWHPYRTLLDLKENKKLGLTNEESSLAWSIINDSYVTDLPLTCPPHLIAMMAVFLAVVFQPSRATLGMQSLPQTPQFPGSLHGRPSVADSLSKSLNNMVSMQGAGPQAPVPAHTDASTQSRATAAAFASEKIQRVMKFLAESEVDLEAMAEATQELISSYEVAEQYSEKTVREVLARYLKGRGLDK